jgi:hypothetical protein
MWLADSETLAELTSAERERERERERGGGEELITGVDYLNT